MTVYGDRVVKAFLICLLTDVLEKGRLSVKIFYRFLICHQFVSLSFKVAAEFTEQLFLYGLSRLEMIRCLELFHGLFLVS